eukprot:TRINITY_DN4037_c0_g1_i2.p1 TRINITY_DN4037_c0_g1~~TRINITY_DN4037_c0_g1_i2.p1  ORF type:complete len:145 (-),score=45.49 TRINITY_DN4037_c0_g1_i2:292-726(-)
MLQPLKELSADSESEIYKTIRGYLGLLEKPSPEVNLQLFSTVRFALLDYESLEDALINDQVPNLCSVKLYLLAKAKLLQRPNASRRIFEYSHDFDKKGIIYFISTNGGKAEWQNPAKTGEIKITGSSIEKGQYENICELDPQEC